MMWVIKEKDGRQSWTIHEDIAASLRSMGFEVTEVVPASEVREREELIQKLADVAFEYEAAHVGEERAESNFVVALRLRKIDGKWERCK